ncbi:CbiX/SirB N-terminal domain-containing protein [Rhodoluna sp. KAS3]|uniref:sirohydrochlorin chelatase n=1 Tax=Rhodoluna sp. KAS3 TaxID=942880 RepID=UPI0022323A91|nr:CbiX/SirB N-terminal domain-containing protein [Rhodoluna sp. KAS3]BDS49631.1 cobalamin biosynthesis protein CbiX [Rhodoluna sp. KAS3]
MATLIAASHGTDNTNGAAAISALVSEVQKALPETRVFEAFVDVQQPDVPTVLDKAGSAEPAILVPLLLATGYHVRQDIADATFAAGEHTQITPALGPDARLVEVLVERLNQVGYKSDDLVVLTVAGSSDPRAQAESQLVQAMLEEALGSKVELAFLSAAEPKLKDLVPKLKFQNHRRRVVVATYLLAEGYFAGVTKKSGAHLATEPLLVNGAEVPQQLVDIIIDRFTSATDATNPRTTGCLSGLRGEPWVGCAAGCASACR